MTLDQIVTFLAVYHSGSYQKAAEQLYLPQSTVSNRVKQLELELSKTLFIRQRSGIRLTEEGHIFLPYAQNAVSSLEEGRLAVRSLKFGASGILMIGCNNSFSNSFVPSVMSAFSECFPDVSIRVLGYTTREQIQKITNNELRLSISRYSLNVPSLTIDCIFQEEVKLIVSRSHPLAGKPHVTLKQLGEQLYISYEPDTLYRKLLELTLGHRNIKYEIKHESSSLSLIKHWVKEGVGVFLAGELLFREELGRGELAAVAIKDNPFPPDKVFLIYKEHQLNRLEQLFVRHITEMMASFG